MWPNLPFGTVHSCKQRKALVSSGTSKGCKTTENNCGRWQKNSFPGELKALYHSRPHQKHLPKGWYLCQRLHFTSSWKPVETLNWTAGFSITRVCFLFSLKSKQFNVVQWPRQSHHLNPGEHAFHLEEEISQKQAVEVKTAPLKGLAEHHQRSIPTSVMSASRLQAVTHCTGGN